MKVITQRDLILEVCTRWKEQYGDRMEMPHFENKRKTYDRLLKLDLHNCTAEDVNRTIGNDSWTSLTCNECGKTTDWLVQVGEEPYDESSTAHLCKACAKQVAMLVQEKA